MGLFELLSGKDINKWIEECKNTPGAVLIDVRGRDEYNSGHIPGSINIPLNSINSVSGRIKEKETKIFVYCLSGARSAQAVSQMKRIGYTNVLNIGGINRYTGEVES